MDILQRLVDKSSCKTMNQMSIVNQAWPVKTEDLHPDGKPYDC